MVRTTGGKRNAKVIGQVEKPKSSLVYNHWVLKLLNDKNFSSDLNNSKLLTKTRGNSLCTLCKGAKFL